MVSLRSIGVMSCAKMMGATYGALGLIFVPLFLLGGFASMALGRGAWALSDAAMGFLIGALSAWIYNLLARWIGGIQLDLRADVVAPQ